MYGDKSGDAKRNNLIDNIMKDQNLDEKLKPPQNLIMSWFQYCRYPKRYKLIKKSKVRIDQELDLVKFVQRMRSLISGTMGLLKSKQRLFVDEFSQILVYESSFFDQLSGSDDGQGATMDDAKNRSIKSLVKSNDKTDRQFINMFRIRQASR